MLLCVVGVTPDLLGKNIFSAGSYPESSIRILFCRYPEYLFASLYSRVFEAVLGIRFGSLELKIGSLQVHTGYLTFSLKKNLLCMFNCYPCHVCLSCSAVSSRSCSACLLCLDSSSWTFVRENLYGKNFSGNNPSQHQKIVYSYTYDVFPLLQWDYVKFIAQHSQLQLAS